MKSTRYKGYTSYSYLEAGTDYRSFTLAREIDRVPSQRVEVTPDQEQRVQRLLNAHLVISLHDHPTVLPDDPAEIVDQKRQGREVTGYQGLSVSGLDAIFDNLMDGMALITSANGWKWSDIIADLGMRLCDIAHQDFLVPARTLQDIYDAKARGQLAWIPSLESSTPIENEIDRLDILYGLGIRMMGIAYSESNALGSGLRERHDGGLTVFGRQAVRRMNQLGMAIDVSHAGDQTALDTIMVSTQPIFISHAGARTLWGSARMKPDAVIQACAAAGGVCGIEAAPHTTLTPQHPQHSIDSIMEHVAYCIDLVGIDHVTLGPDTLFGDHVGLHHAFDAQLSIGEETGPAYEEVPFVNGIESPAEALLNGTRWLVVHGFGDDDIAKLIGGNTARVLQQVWWG